MSSTRIHPTDPTKLIQTLDPDTIRKRLDELDRERKALLVLLRASVRAQKDRQPKDVQ